MTRPSQGVGESSPKTARFSSFQKNLLRASKRGGDNPLLDLSNISRDNIKQNTKNLMGEINDIDEEIITL